jgi:hypothetical protein
MDEWWGAGDGRKQLIYKINRAEFEEMNDCSGE